MTPQIPDGQQSDIARTLMPVRPVCSRRWVKSVVITLLLLGTPILGNAEPVRLSCTYDDGTELPGDFILDAEAGLFEWRSKNRERARRYRIVHVTKTYVTAVYFPSETRNEDPGGRLFVFNRETRHFSRAAVQLMRFACDDDGLSCDLAGISASAERGTCVITRQHAVPYFTRQ